MKVRSRVLTAATALALAGCAAWNAPINTVLKDGERPEEIFVNLVNTTAGASLISKQLGYFMNPEGQEVKSSETGTIYLQAEASNDCP